MSRSGYSDDIWEDDGNRGWLYRANVDRAIGGKRGQAFLHELIAALDDLPEKKLIAESFVAGEGVCALGSVARLRGITEKITGIDPEDNSSYVAGVFGIADCMAREIMYENDGEWRSETEDDEQRWARIRRWAESRLATDVK